MSFLKTRNTSNISNVSKTHFNSVLLSQAHSVENASKHHNLSYDINSQSSTLDLNKPLIYRTKNISPIARRHLPKLEGLASTQNNTFFDIKKFTKGQIFKPKIKSSAIESRGFFSKYQQQTEPYGKQYQMKVRSNKLLSFFYIETVKRF